ncbi:MAG: hypothetical protein ACFE96_01635 [Candidatus Hermodarchaeota archaeon]
MLDLSKIGQYIKKEFPILPEPKSWQKNEKKRLYINYIANGYNYSFFIDLSDKGHPYIGQKSDWIWNKDFPSKREIIDKLNSLFGFSNATPFLPTKKGTIACFFLINPEKLGSLYAYKIYIDKGNLNEIGGKLGYRLRNHFKGFWNFSNGILLSNFCVDDHELNEYLKELWSNESETFKYLNKIECQKNLTVSSKIIADFTANYLTELFYREINSVLRNYSIQKEKICIKREVTIRGWSIYNKPVISISINSNIYYEETLDKFYSNISTKRNLIGFPVIDIDKKHKACILDFLGPLKNHHEKLLSFPMRNSIKRCLIKAPDSEMVLLVGDKSKQEGYHYVASSLYPIVTTKNLHYFHINPSHLMKSLTMSPKLRVRIISEILNVLQDYIAKGYNSENFPELFKLGQKIGFDNSIRFHDKLKFPYDEIYVLKGLKEHGIYRFADKYKKDNSFRICLLLGPKSNKVSEFHHKVEKELKLLGLNPHLTDKINIEQIDRVEIETKLQHIEEDVDIILAILPDYTRNQDKDQIYEIVRSSLFNKGIIRSQFIFQSTIQNKLNWALANIILGILAKTNNICYILDSPLDFADFFVGIDISREKKRSLRGSQNFAAVVRFYGKNGTFYRYEIEEEQIEGETVPKIVLERMFAKQEFQNKTIMIHRDGYFRGNEIPDLKDIAKEYNITFQFVEVIKTNVPRIINCVNGTYQNPIKNQIFYLNANEAIIINNQISGDRTAKPLRIKVCDSNTNLDQAIISIMALRIMNFGSTKPSKLPVTISFSDRISGFLRKGIRPPHRTGVVPWWY